MLRQDYHLPTSIGGALAMNCCLTRDKSRYYDATTMYEYRKLTDEQKAEVLRQRQLRGYPLHAPPHLRTVEGWFLVTAATYEHKAHCAPLSVISEPLRRVHARTARELNRRAGLMGRQVWSTWALNGCAMRGVNILCATMAKGGMSKS